MCATIEKFLIRASVITSQSSTPPSGGPASDTQPRTVSDDRTRLENHVGADFRVSPDVGIGGDDTVGQTCAFSYAHAFPKHGVLHVSPGADPTAGAERGARPDAGPAADLAAIAHDGRAGDPGRGPAHRGFQPRAVVTLAGRHERRPHAAVEQVHLGRAVGARAADVAPV